MEARTAATKFHGKRAHLNWKFRCYTVNEKPVKIAVFACDIVSPLTRTVQFDAYVSVLALTSNLESAV